MFNITWDSCESWNIRRRFSPVFKFLENWEELFRLFDLYDNILNVLSMREHICCAMLLEYSRANHTCLFSLSSFVSEVCKEWIRREGGRDYYNLGNHSSIEAEMEMAIILKDDLRFLRFCNPDESFGNIFFEFFHNSFRFQIRIFSNSDST